MREIKFRAWDGNRMYHFDNHEWTLDFNDISGWNVVKNLPFDQLKGRAWDAGESSKTADSFCLMQYVGLKDKNGKDIYEGDLIQVDSRETSIGEVVFDNAEFKIRVNHFNVFWKLKYKNNYKQEMEVVGNIHQHKHLLK